MGRSMHKRLNITLDEAVYDGLIRVVGRRKISQFLEDLARPHVSENDLHAGYREMAADEKREADALAFADALIGDVPHEAG